MPSSVTRPVAAALGLVPSVLGGVRRLPGKAAQLPVYAVSHALTGIGTARAGYDNLAERGERLIAMLRGTSVDKVEDALEDALEGTPLAKPYERVEDALEDAAESVTALVRNGTARARKATPAKAADPAQAVAKAERAVAEAAERAAEAAAEAAEKAEAAGVDPKKAERQRKNPAQAPKGAATPKASEPDSTRIDTAAAPEVVQAVEQVSAQVGGQVLAHDDLPLADYDHLTLGSLRGRIRSLDLPQLIQIRDYEKAHADRLPIVTMLDNRIAKLASDPTAPLSGDPAGSSTPDSKSGKAGKAGKAATSPKAAKVTPQTADDGASNPNVAFGGLGGSRPR